MLQKRWLQSPSSNRTPAVGLVGPYVMCVSLGRVSQMCHQAAMPHKPQPLLECVCMGWVKKEGDYHLDPVRHWDHRSNKRTNSRRLKGIL